MPDSREQQTTAETNAIAAGESLLEVRDLRTWFVTRDVERRAVDGVTLRVGRGQTLGVVGESGCGKSVTALSILRLIPVPPGRIVGGEIRFKGRNLLDLREISMIFQEPMTSLNPVFTAGYQVGEVLRIHLGLGKSDAHDRAVEMLRQVRIPDPERRAREYPHQMSGGMRQRVMIAMALACNPDLLIADEPTTALDVTVQAQILRLMNDLREQFHSAIMMITHDLGVVAETCDHVAVMYAGQIVEESATRPLFDHPLHPYTQGLMRSVPRLDWIAERRPIHPIPGSVPDPAHFHQGCSFHPRCPFANEGCLADQPLLVADAGHGVRCHRWKEIQENPERAAATADVAKARATHPLAAAG